MASSLVWHRGSFRARLGALCIAAAASLAGTAHAELLILTKDGTPATSFQAPKSYNPVSGGWTIQLNVLYAPGGETVYNIHGNGGEIIDNLIINVPCWQGPSGDCVPAGSPLFVRIISDPPLGVHTVKNIIQTGEAETLLDLVEVTHDIGAVQVEHIGLLSAGRDILGPVIGTTEENPVRGITTAQAGRDIRGDLTAPNGRVGTVIAGRHIGTPGQPVKITSRHNALRIDAADDLYAVIDASYNDGPGHLWRMTCSRYFGDLAARTMAAHPQTGAPGRIEVFDFFEGAITFGESLMGLNQHIEMPLFGLSGQIIVNAENLPDGMWNVPVKVGPDGHDDQVVLTSPTYPQSNESLGGGAVGLVPFALHEFASAPALGETIIAESDADLPQSVHLHHYGPVTWSGPPPLVIQRRDAGSEGAWTTLPLSNFEIARSSADAKVIHIQPAGDAPGFAIGSEYRITPTDALRCDVPGEPPVQWLQPHVFSIIEAETPACPGDLNNDGVVNIDDLLILLAFWGNAGAFPAADINNDGTVGIDDLLILLSNWGPCSSGDDPGTGTLR